MSKKTRRKPGPAAEVLKLSGDWKAAMKKSLKKKKPPGGWPKAGK
jgi:hypothetical protein